MGFEPFIPPKRVIPAPDKLPEGASRQDRILALAQLLHARGLTSSMTDAKRLAEGMVDVERKVVVKETKAYAEHTAKQRTDIPTAQSTAKPPQAATKLRLTEEFSQFVAKAAVLSHEEIKPTVTIDHTPAKTSSYSSSSSVSYGRGDEQHTVTHVPHVLAHKQVFYEDAPSITMARGYKGPRPQSVEFQTQSEEFLKKTAAKSSSPSQPDFQRQRDEAMQKINEQVTRVSASPDAVKVTTVETAPNVEIIQETMVVREAPSSSELLAEADTMPAEPDEDEAVESEAEVVPEPAPRPEPVKTEPQREDLAKKHGVDLFDMFKKKT